LSAEGLLRVVAVAVAVFFSPIQHPFALSSRAAGVSKGPPPHVVAVAVFDASKQGDSTTRWELVKHCNCTVVGTSREFVPAADLLLLLRQKKEARKGDPDDGAPLRGVHAPPAPETGSIGNSLRSDSRRFFFRFRHWRRVAIDGESQKPSQRQLHKQRQRQLQLSLRGTAIV
jgi:hypothetical protein